VNTPFLIKTRRSKPYTRLNSTELTLLFIIDAVNLKTNHNSGNYIKKKLLTLHNTNFIATTYKLLKKIFFKKNGLITNNFTKSMMYATLSSTLSLFKKVKIVGITSTPTSKLITQYLLPVQIFTISIHKSKPKTILFLLLNNLLTMLPSYSQAYMLSTTYLYLPTSLNILTFVNLFYFKLRNF
jgi:hypothetical protein